MRYSCRAVVGHGQKCEPNYQCDACAAKQKYIPRIEKLEAALKPFADLAYESDGEMYERLAHNLEDGLFIKARKTLEGKDD